MRFWKIRSRCPNYPWFMSCSVSSSHIRTWMASPFRIQWKISSILTFKLFDWKQTWSGNLAQDEIFDIKDFRPSFCVTHTHWMHLAGHARITNIVFFNSGDFLPMIFTILNTEGNLELQLLISTSQEISLESFVYNFKWTAKRKTN
jgi:hypothetical protein